MGCCEVTNLATWMRACADRALGLEHRLSIGYVLSRRRWSIRRAACAVVAASARC
jgi:hypothetical protein